MAIVRDLLIRIGFRTDKRAINATNQAIIGFKTRFALAAGAAVTAFSKITQFYRDIATATLDSNELAKSLGLSLKELIAIQNAAQKVGRLDFNQTNQAFTTLNKMLINFRSGLNSELPKIANAFNFNIDITGGPEKLFQQILTGLSLVANEQERVRIASNIFGDELGPRISSLAKNITEFKEATQDFNSLGESSESALQNFKLFEEAFNSLARNAQSLGITIASFLGPGLTIILNILSSTLEVLNGLANFDFNIIKKGLKVASSALDPLFDFTGLNRVSKAFQNTLFGGGAFINGIDNNLNRNNQSALDYYKNAGISITPTGGASAVFNTSFDVVLPTGTTQEMTDQMFNQVNEKLQDSWMQNWEQIQNNYPVIE